MKKIKIDYKKLHQQMREIEKMDKAIKNLKTSFSKFKMAGGFEQDLKTRIDQLDQRRQALVQGLGQ